MAAHTSTTATAIPPVAADQPPGGWASWLRDIAQTLNALMASAAATYAPLASPVFTGDPQAPTPPTADNDTSIATTAYVKAQFAGDLTLGGSLSVHANVNPTIDVILGGAYTAAFAPDGTGTTGGIFYGNVGTGNVGLYRRAVHSFQDNAGGTVIGAFAGGLIVGAPTGGDKGAGTINAVQVYANNVLLTSDASLKTDIDPLSDCLPLVAAIEPKSYRWAVPDPLPARPATTTQTAPLTIDELGPPGFFERRNLGFLAQDVQKTLGGDPDSVDLGGLVAVLWGAVRELSARLESLERR
jgi:hypothetical protein